MVQQYSGRRAVLCALVLTGVVGSEVRSIPCWKRTELTTRRLPKKASPKLEVPPDLTQIRRDDRYAMPAGSVTATDYLQKQTQSASGPAAATVALNTIGTDVRIERAGSQRWLVVKKSPEVLWPQIKTFWQDLGFLINIEQPDAGIGVKPSGPENRAKSARHYSQNVGQDWRRTLFDRRTG